MLSVSIETMIGRALEHFILMDFNFILHIKYVNPYLSGFMNF